MSSKTARSSAVKEVAKAKQIIPDAELIRLERIQRASGLHATCQGADALIRRVDALEQQQQQLVVKMEAA